MGSAFLLTPMQIGGANSLTVSPLNAPPQNPFVIRNGEMFSAIIFVPRNSSETGFIGVTFNSQNLTNLNSQLSAINSMVRSDLDSRINSLSRELGLNVPIPNNVDEARNLAKSLISQYWYNQNQNRLIEAYSRNLNSTSFRFDPFVFGSSATPTVALPSPTPVRTLASLSLLSGSSSDVVSRLSASGMFWNPLLREPLMSDSEIQTIQLLIGRIDERRTSLSQDAIISLNRTLGNGAPLMDAISHDLPTYSSFRVSHFRRPSFTRLLNEIYSASSSLFTPSEQERIRSGLAAISSRELETTRPSVPSVVAAPAPSPLTTSERSNLQRQIVNQNRANIDSRTTRTAIVNLLVDLSAHPGFRSQFENDGEIINQIQAGPREFVESLRALLPNLHLSANQTSSFNVRITNILRDLPQENSAPDVTPSPNVAPRVYPTQVSDQTVSRLRGRYGPELGNNFDSFISILRELYPLPNGVVSGYFEDLVNPAFNRYPPFSNLITYLREVVNSDRYPLTEPNRVRLRNEIAALLRPTTPAPTVVQRPPETLTQTTLVNLRRSYSSALGSRTEELVSLVQDLCARDSYSISVFNSTNFSRTDVSRFLDLLDQRIVALTGDSSSLQSRADSLRSFISRPFNTTERTQITVLLSRTFSNQTLPSASRAELSGFLLRLSRERGFRPIVPNVSALETQLNSGGFASFFNFISTVIPRLDSANGASLTTEFNRIRTAIESRFGTQTQPTPAVTASPQPRQISLALSSTERPIFDLIQRGNPRQLLERIQSGSLNSLSSESMDRLLLNIYQYAVSHPDSVLSDNLEQHLSPGYSLSDLDQTARLRSIRENINSGEEAANLVSILRRLNLLGANDSISQNPRFLLLASAVLIWRDSHRSLVNSPVGSWYETPRAPEVQVQLNPTQTSVSTNVLSGNYSALFAQRAALTDETLRPVAQDISSRLMVLSNVSPLAAAYRAYLSTRGSRFVSNGSVSDPIEALRLFAAYTVLNPTDRYSADSRALLSALHPPPSTVRNLTNPQSNLFDLVSSLAVMRWRDNNPNTRTAPTPNFVSELNPSSVVNVAPTPFARSAIDLDHQQILDDTFNGQQYRRILQSRTSGFSDSTQNNLMIDVVYARISQSNEPLPYSPRIAAAASLRNSYASLRLNPATTTSQKVEHLLRAISEYARAGRNAGSELFCSDAVALLSQIDPRSQLLSLFNRSTTPPSAAILTDSQFTSIAQGASLYQVFTLLSIAERRIRDRTSSFDYPTELSALGFARPVVSAPRPTTPVAIVTPTTSAPTVSVDSSIVEGFRFSGMDRHQYDQFDSSRYRQVPNLPQSVSDQLGFVIGGEGNAASPYIVNIPVFSPNRPGQSPGEVLVRTQSFEIPIGGVHVQFFYTYVGPNVQRPANYPQNPNALALSMIMNLRRNRHLDSAALGRALNHDVNTSLNSGETTLLNYLRSAHLTYVQNYSLLATTVFGPVTPSTSQVRDPMAVSADMRHAGTPADPYIINVPLRVPSTLYPNLTELVLPVGGSAVPTSRSGFYRVRFIFNRATSGFSNIDLRREIIANVVPSVAALPANRGPSAVDYARGDLTLVIRAVSQDQRGHSSLPELLRPYVR